MRLVMDKLEIPMSSLDPGEVSDFVNATKEALRNADIDIRDAKRRISSVKPKKSKNKDVDQQQSSESEGSD